MNAVNGMIFEIGKKLAAKSPKLAIVAGCVGLAAAGVMAYKRHDRANEIIEETLEEIEGIKEQGLSKRENGRLITSAYGHCFVRLGGVFALPAAVAALSVCSIRYGVVKYDKALALAAASYLELKDDYDSLQSEYLGYLEEHGDDERIHGYLVETVTEPGERDPETGKKTKSKRDVTKHSPKRPAGASRFAVLFSDHCDGYSEVPGVNVTYLQAVQNYWNRKLHERTNRLGYPGRVTWAEILHHMGMEEAASTWKANTCGWYDNGETDPICLGFDDMSNPLCKAFMNGEELSVWLDPNIQGELWDVA